MEEKGKKQIVAGIDLFVGVMILFVGILVILMGLSYGEFIDATYRTSGGIISDTNPYKWISKTPWIVLLLGLGTIIYSIKRLVEDLLKIA